MPASSSAGMWKIESGRKMKHPNRATLALHTGEDLGPFARWRTSRHLAKCEDCRREMAAFGVVRGILPELSAIPEVPWNRLAAEMKANIDRKSTRLNSSHLVISY